MPRSVISTVVVDAIMPAEELPGRIMAHVRNEPFAEEPALPALINREPRTPEEALDEVLRLLLEVGGIDFKDYKPATIMRRIERRMPSTSCCWS